MEARPHNFCTVVPSRSMLGNRPTEKKNASVDGDDKGFATRDACVLGIDKRKKTKYFSVHGIKKITVSSSLLLFVFFFTFHFWARRQKRMQCLRRFSVTRLSWLHDDVSPSIQKGSERFNVFKQPRQRSSCSQLSTKGFKMWCVLKIWIKKYF